MTLRQRVADFARVPGDTDQDSFAKALILVVALSCSACGVVWSAMYRAVFGPGLTAALPLAFVVIVGAAIVVSERMSDARPLIYAQLGCITWISALIQWSIGSAVGSGLVICWSFLGPIGALMFLSLREATVCMAMFLVIVGISAIAEPALLGAPLEVAPGVQAMFLTMNVGTSLLVAFAAAAWFVRTIQSERARSDTLLAEMLPDSIVRRLKDGARTIADQHAEVSVLFADIVGFTTYSAKVPPETLVAELNAIFERFDELAAAHGVEKIKTIGDAYMVACGVPDHCHDHARVMAEFALALQGARQGQGRHGRVLPDAVTVPGQQTAGAAGAPPTHALSWGPPPGRGRAPHPWAGPG